MLEVHHVKLFYHLIKNRNVKKYVFENRYKNIDFNKFKFLIKIIIESVLLAVL